MLTSALIEQKCTPQHTALTSAEVTQHLSTLDGWQAQDGKIARTYAFNNYYETLSFINAIAYVIHAEDHHPELTVTYQHCAVRFDTHSVNHGQGGLSLNDFICAAKINAIFQQSFS